MTIPTQAVSLVAQGGTPVQITNQKGAAYPTTGHGALVFNIGAHLVDPVIENATVEFDHIRVPPGTLADPAIQLTITNARTSGLFSTGPGNLSVVGTDGTEPSRRVIAAFDWPGDITATNHVLISGFIPPDDATLKAATTHWVNQTYAPLISPHFGGIPTVPDPVPGDISNQIPNTQWVHSNYVGLDSPHFTGTPTAPSPPPGDDSERLATTEWVTDNFTTNDSPDFTGIPTVPDPPYPDSSNQITNTRWVTEHFATIDSPEFTGIPTAPPPAPADDSEQIATTGWVRDIFAPLDSPHLIGEPLSITPDEDSPATMIVTKEYVDFLLAPPGTINYIGAGDWHIDVPALQLLIDTAPPGVQLINLIGDIELGWGEVGSSPTPDFYSYNSPTRPMFLAIKLLRGNLIFDGTAATIRHAQPPFNGVGGIVLPNARPSWVCIGTMENVQPRTLSNIQFRNCTFHCNPTGGGHFIFLAGIGAVTLRNNLMGNVSRHSTVSLNRQAGTNDVLVVWPTHGANGRLDVVSFYNPVTENMEAGREYYVHVVDNNNFKISRVDDGPNVFMNPGEPNLSTTGDLTDGVGFGMWLDNCDDLWSFDNKFEYMQQGVFTNYCRNAHWINETYVQMVEAFDVQTVLQRGSWIGCKFLRGQDEAQSLDLAGVQDVIVSNNVFDQVRNPYQFYCKTLPPTYAQFREHGYGNTVQFQAGTPGRVLMTAGQEAHVGMRIWFEFLPPPSPSNIKLFPGETWNPGSVGPPVVLAHPNGDGNINKYTTYIVDSVDLGTASFTIKAQAYDADGNVTIPPTTTGPTIAFANAGSTDCHMSVIADDPSLIITASNIMCSNNIATNLVTSDSSNPDGDQLGARVCRIGTGRELRVGIDRQQFVNGTPPQVSRIRMVNNSFEGGRFFDIQEVKDLEIDGLWLNGQDPGVDTDGNNKEALTIQQAMASTPAATQQQGILTGSMRNVHILGSRGRGFVLRMPGEFRFEDIEVRTYGLSGAPLNSGGFISNLLRKGGLKKFGPINISGGNPAVPGVVLDMRLLESPTPGVNVRIALEGPFDLGTPVGSTSLRCDVGPYLTEREQWFLPRPIVSSSVADVRAYVVSKSLARRHLLWTSLILMEALPAVTSVKTTFTAATYNAGTGNVTGLTATSGFLSNVQNKFLVTGAVPAAYNGWKTALSGLSSNTQLVWPEPVDPGGPMTVMGTVNTVANHTQVRVSSLDSAGVLDSITGFIGIDNGPPPAAFTQIDLPINATGVDPQVDLAIDDTLVLEFRGVGTGSTISQQMLSYAYLPFSDVT